MLVCAQSKMMVPVCDSCSLWLLGSGAGTIFEIPTPREADTVWTCFNLNFRRHLEKAVELRSVPCSTFLEQMALLDNRPENFSLKFNLARTHRLAGAVSDLDIKLGNMLGMLAPVVYEEAEVDDLTSRNVDGLAICEPHVCARCACSDGITVCLAMKSFSVDFYEDSTAVPVKKK